MKKAIFSTFFLFLITNLSYAQFSMRVAGTEFYRLGNIQKVGNLSEKILVVKLYEYDKKRIKKLHKKGEYESAMKKLDESNEFLVNTVKTHWKLGNTIKTSKEVRANQYKDNENYLVLDIVNRSDAQMKRNVRHIFDYSMIHVTCGGKYLTYYSNTGGNFIDFEIKAAIEFFNTVFQASSKDIQWKSFPAFVNQNAGELKNMTLLIPSDITKLKQDQIRSLYPYKFKMVSLKEMSEKLENQDDAYAFYWPQHQDGSCGTGFHHGIYACKDARLLELIREKKVRIGTYGGNAPLVYEIFYSTSPGFYTVPLSKFLRKGTLEALTESVGSNL